MYVNNALFKTETKWVTATCLKPSGKRGKTAEKKKGKISF